MSIRKEQEIIDKKIDKFMAELSEHHLICGIQIFATMKSGTQGFSMATGSGDWYSRLGHVQEWLWQQKARSGEFIKKHDLDEDEDGASTDL